MKRRQFLEELVKTGVSTAAAVGVLPGVARAAENPFAIVHKHFDRMLYGLGEILLGHKERTSPEIDPTNYTGFTTGLDANGSTRMYDQVSGYLTRGMTLLRSARDTRDVRNGFANLATAHDIVVSSRYAHHFKDEQGRAVRQFALDTATNAVYSFLDQQEVNLEQSVGVYAVVGTDRDTRKIRVEDGTGHSNLPIGGMGKGDFDKGEWYVLPVSDLRENTGVYSSQTTVQGLIGKREGRAYTQLHLGQMLNMLSRMVDVSEKRPFVDPSWIPNLYDQGKTATDVEETERRMATRWTNLSAPQWGQIMKRTNPHGTFQNGTSIEGVASGNAYLPNGMSLRPISFWSYLHTNRNAADGFTAPDYKPMDLRR